MTKRQWVALAVLIGSAMGVALTVRWQTGFDFVSFYQSGEAVRAGVSPYASGIGFYNPLYVAASFAPVSILPFDVAYRIHAFVCIIAFGVSFYFLTNCRLDLTILLMLSPFPLMTAWYGNLEWAVLLGAALPITGLWLLLIKPQIGITLAIMRCYKMIGNRQWIVLVAIGLVFIYSLSTGMLSATPTEKPWNISIWPSGIPIGFAIAWLAWKRQSARLGLLSAPFLSPYLTFLSLGVALPALATSLKMTTIIVTITWLIVIKTI